MFAKFLGMSSAALLAAAVLVWAVGGSCTSAYAQGCCGGGHCGGGHAGHDASSAAMQEHGMAASGHAGHGGQPDLPMSSGHAQRKEPAPHGGQLVAKSPLIFEVVFQPKEVRLYLYGPWPQPRSTKDIQAVVSLKRPKEKDATRVEMKYVAAASGEQDYLSAAANLSAADQKDLTAAFKLKNLPLAAHATVEFARAVVISKAAHKVTPAELDKNDEAGIAKQKVCPVTGAQLGSMGDPIKLLIDGKPLYLCCQGCVAKVKSDPEKYLSKVNRSQAEK
jgi:hypothetical protein